jgi:glutamate formiminotransferase
MSLICCVPNVSEGRRGDVIDALAQRIRSVEGVALLDHSADPSHHRSVFTFVGDAASLERAVLALFDRAIDVIDLRVHIGEHPRVGAVDVVPFVPLHDTPMSECVALARRVGSAVASRFHVPVYLYEEAATDPARRSLEDIRRGGLEALARKMTLPGWAPDFGPPAPHPKAGASVVGARRPLVAFNVNLASMRLDLAKAIASVVRSRSGGLPGVKALGIELRDRGIVQVSMNLTDYRQTSIRRAFDAVAEQAKQRGVEVLESEIIGLIPAAALAPGDADHLALRKPADESILENRLAAIARSAD